MKAIGLASFAPGENLCLAPALILRLSFHFRRRADIQTLRTNRNVAAHRSVDVHYFARGQHVAVDFSVQLGDLRANGHRAADFGFGIQLDGLGIGHHVFRNRGVQRDRLAPEPDVAVHRAIHTNLLREAQDVALDMSVDGQVLSPNDQVAVDLPINLGAVGQHAEVALHLLPGSECVDGIAGMDVLYLYLHVLRRHRLRDRQGEREGAHHERDRREALPLPPQQPDSDKCQRAHGHDFH